MKAGAKGYQDFRIRPSWRSSIWLVQSSTAKVLFHFGHFEQILTMDLLEADAPLTVNLALKFGSTKGEVLPTKGNKEGAINNVNAKRVKRRKQFHGSMAGKAP